MPKCKHYKFRWLSFKRCTKPEAYNDNGNGFQLFNCPYYSLCAYREDIDDNSPNR